MTKKHKTVADLYKSIETDKEKRKKFTENSNDLSLARMLFGMRNSLGITQSEMGKKLNCTQGAISKLERTSYKDIQFGAIVDYTDACGLTPVLLFKPKKTSCAAEVRYHLHGLELALQELENLCDSDKEMGIGAAKFLLETIAPVIDKVGDVVKSAGKTIKKSKKDVPFILGDPESACSGELVSG